MEAVLPARMGTPFRWLVGSAWVGNLGDGIALAAGPLLVASQTSDPLLVALSGLLQRLPWLLFGLGAGVLADRVDRKLLVIAVDLMRAAVLVVLTLALVTGNVNVPVVLVALFLLGTAEVFVDTTTGTLLPMVVDKRDLGIGNARLTTAGITMNQLVGPAVGAALFAVGMAWPFGVQAVCLALGAVLISRMAAPPLVRPAGPSHVGRDIAEGFRWTWGNRAVRTLTVTLVLFNVTYGAAWSILVLYATQVLDMGPVGFGLLTTVGALGGLVGTAGYDWLERRASLATIMRVGLVVDDLHPPGAGPDDDALGGADRPVRLRRPRFHLGDDGAHRAHAGGAGGAAGPGGQPLLDRRVRRHRRRSGPRRRHRAGVGPHRAVLVRLRGLRRPAGAALEEAGAHRPRRRDGAGRGVSD